jgi:hypothetical protein
LRLGAALVDFSSVFLFFPLSAGKGDGKGRSKGRRRKALSGSRRQQGSKGKEGLAFRARSRPIGWRFFAPFPSPFPVCCFFSLDPAPRGKVFPLRFSHFPQRQRKGSTSCFLLALCRKAKPEDARKRKLRAEAARSCPHIKPRTSQPSSSS